MPYTKDNSSKILITIIIIIGFIFIQLSVSWYENENSEILLFTSDSNTEFANDPTSTNYIYDNSQSPDSPAIVSHFVSIQYEGLESPPKFFNYSHLYPIYLGNNTWGVTTKDCLYPPYVGINDVIQIRIPDADNWIMTKTIVNMTLNGEDYRFATTFEHYNTPFRLTDFGSGYDYTWETKLLHEEIGIQDEYTQVYNIPLDKSLLIYEQSQDKEFHTLEVGVIRNNLATVSEGYLMVFSVEIFGYKQTTKTLENVVNVAIGFSSIINIMAVAVIFKDDKRFSKLFGGK